jgi:hypothetical protein
MKQVHTTKDYSLFKSIEGNRNKNLLHINRLKKSMSENYLFTTITVNEFYEIIDGNHRFDVINELELPLNYIVCPGYGLNEVHILNQNSKTWNADDYLNGYCNLGYKDYLEFADFKEKYKLGFNETLALLTGSLNRYNEMFYKGEFKIKSMWYAVDLIEKILLIEPYYKAIRRRSFIYTMMSLSKNKNFSFSEFLQKLKLQPTSLQDCTSVENYKALIEDIYNYHRREKVNLKY